MRRYSDREVLRIAAAETLRVIRRDRRQAPQSLKKLFAVIARDLFKPEMKAQYAWKKAGIKNHSLGTVFKELTGVSLKRYINRARIEVARVLICTTDLQLATISMMLGYDYHPTFAKNFKQLNDGKLPSKLPRLGTDGPTIDDVKWMMFGRGELEDDEAEDCLRSGHQLYPKPAARLQRPAPTSRGPLIVVEGERQCRLTAGGLWLEIRDLPFEEQKREVRGYLFCTEALFDLLRKKSRQRGRKNRQQGIELAKLALVSLEQSDEVFEDRIHDLRALGWAWLGNAYVLAMDFSTADMAFGRFDQEWSRPRTKRDQGVLAMACRFEGILRMFQRNYLESGALLDRSFELFQILGNDREQAQTLLQRASLHGYAGRLGSSVEDLRAAASLINEPEQQDLVFALRGNLANVLTRSGKYRAAKEELDRAREVSSEINQPLAAPMIDWIDGFIKERCGDLKAAQALYVSSRSAFSDAGESCHFALVSVDLMVTYSKQDAWNSVLEVAKEVLPVLDTFKLHSETVAAVNLMAQAAQAQALTYPLLKELRERLRQDPLATL